MRTIFSVGLTPSARTPQTAHLPVDAGLLCVRMQGDTPTLWLLGTTSGPTQQVTFVLLGTGDAVRDGERGDRYLGTVQEHPGAPVWHVFRATDG